MEMVSVSFRHTPKMKWFGERRVVCMAEILSKSEQTAIQSEAMREKLKQNIGADYESFETLANRTTKLPEFDAQRDGQYVSLFVSLIAQKNKNPKDSDGLNQFMKSHPPKFLANMPVGNNAINARSNLNYYPGGPHRFMTGNVTDIDVHFFADDDLQIALEKEWENFQKAREEVRTALGGMSNSLSPYLVAHVYLKGNLPPNIRSVIANSPASSSAQSKILQTLHIEPSATKAVEMSQKYTALEEGNVLRMETEVTGLDMPLFLSRYQQVKQEYPELSVENLSTQSQGIQLLEAVRGVPGNSDEFIKSVDTFIKGMQKGEPKTLAQFVILQNALERYDQNQSLNATAEGKLKAEQNGEGKTLANFTGNSIEKMFDLIQNGDNMAKVSSIGILSVLVLGFFGKGPLGEIKMIKNALIGLGLAAAIEKVGTEMNGGLSPFQGIYDALQDNPSGFRQQFLKRNGIENRNNEVLISTLEDVPMKQILEFRENINEQLAKGGKNISYYNAKADLPPEGIRKAIREASSGSGMPYDKEELAKMVYDISGKLMLDIGRNQSETTASKTQGTLIHEGEQYAKEHYEQNTMGNILDIYEGVESIRENLNITQKIRQSFGDGAEWVWKGIQHLDGATRDEALAFLQRTKEQRGGNLWKGVKLLFGKGWELTKDGAGFVFRDIKVEGYSLETAWNANATQQILSYAKEGVALFFTFPLDAGLWTAEQLEAIGHNINNFYTNYLKDWMQTLKTPDKRVNINNSDALIDALRDMGIYEKIKKTYGLIRDRDLNILCQKLVSGSNPSFETLAKRFDPSADIHNISYTQIAEIFQQNLLGINHLAGFVTNVGIGAERATLEAMDWTRVLGLTVPEIVIDAVAIGKGRYGGEPIGNISKKMETALQSAKIPYVNSNAPQQRKALADIIEKNTIKNHIQDPIWTTSSFLELADVTFDQYVSTYKTIGPSTLESADSYSGIPEERVQRAKLYFLEGFSDIDKMNTFFQSNNYGKVNAPAEAVKALFMREAKKKLDTEQKRVL